MNDTLSIKDLTIASLDAANFAGSARNFARVASPTQNTHIRRSSHLGSLSPTDLRVAHQPRSAKSEVQRSLFAFEQTLGRVDTLSNPIGEDKFSFALQANIPKGITLAEFRSLAMTAVGAMLENNAALLDAMYYGET